MLKPVRIFRSASFAISSSHNSQRQWGNINRKKKERKKKERKKKGKCILRNTKGRRTELWKVFLDGPVKTRLANRPSIRFPFGGDICSNRCPLPHYVFTCIPSEEASTSLSI